MCAKEKQTKNIESDQIYHTKLKSLNERIL